VSFPNAAAQTEDFEFAALNEAKNYRHACCGSFAAPLRGQVLEVGAGIGQITEMLLQIRRSPGWSPSSRTRNSAPGFRAAFPAHRHRAGHD